jgi:RHS repeat-associated protein
VDRRSSGKGTLEEYRYDALGRRVWVRTAINCQPSTSLECGTSAVQRTMWDGSAEVAELRAPYDAGNPALEETDSGLPSQPPAYYGDINPFFGRVVYAPGLAVDEPLSVTRYEYRDRVSGAISNSALTWPTFTLMPFYDYRSTPVWGLFANGAVANPYLSGGSSCPPPGSGGTQRCVLLSWPFAGNAWNKARGGGLLYSWHGSIIATKRDGSGLHYMRNRVYDPGTGRFTQEDPIGLAGGLNAYGFAGGDPRNSSDPFGLCPPNRPLCHWIEATSALVGSVAGFIGGGGGGTLFAIATGGVGIPAVPAGAYAGAGLGGAAGLAAGKLLTAHLFSSSGSDRSPREPWSGLQKQVDKHRETLANYLRDPYAGDDGRLANAASDAIRDRIIKGRINDLEGQIRNFVRQIREMGGIPR